MKYRLEKVYSDYANVHKVCREALQISDRSGINSILIGGSLLGYIRDGDLLPWDKDVDFAVFEDQAEQVFALEPEFRQAGFEVRHHYSGIRRELECDKGLHLLGEICTLLTDYNITYCLAGGALLNIYRDGRLHPQTDTLALLIQTLSQSQFATLSSELAKFGTIYTTQDEGKIKSICICYGEWRVNLFSLYEGADGFFWKDLNCIHHVSDNLLNVREFPAANYRFSIPVETEGFLSAKYGSNWNAYYAGDFNQGRVHGIMQTYKDEVLVDFIIHYARGEKTYWFEPKANVISTKGFIPAENRKTSFGNVQVPQFAEIFLTEHYGDWKVPVKQWDGAVDNPTIIPHQEAMDKILDGLS